MLGTSTLVIPPDWLNELSLCNKISGTRTPRIPKFKQFLSKLKKEHDERKKKSILSLFPLDLKDQMRAGALYKEDSNAKIVPRGVWGTVNSLLGIFCAPKSSSWFTSSARAPCIYFTLALLQQLPGPVMAQILWGLSVPYLPQKCLGFGRTNNFLLTCQYQLPRAVN